MFELLDDTDRVVAREAACALGQMGWGEARAALLRLLREAPSAPVIDSTSSVADEVAALSTYSNSSETSQNPTKAIRSAIIDAANRLTLRRL